MINIYKIIIMSIIVLIKIRIDNPTIFYIKTCFFPNLPLCRLKFCLVLLNMAFAKGHMPFLHLLYKVEPRSILYGIDHRTAAFFVLHCELLPLSHRIVPLHSSSSAQ